MGKDIQSRNKVLYVIGMIAALLSVIPGVGLVIVPAIVLLIVTIIVGKSMNDKRSGIKGNIVAAVLTIVYAFMIGIVNVLMMLDLGTKIANDVATIFLVLGFIIMIIAWIMNAMAAIYYYRLYSAA